MAGPTRRLPHWRQKPPVIEGMGLEGFGAHSNNAEYVELASIGPRLYLLTRLIMDVAKGETGALK